MTSIQVLHADSLAGPMGRLKAAFEGQNPGIAVNLTSGRSKELAERILAGAACDVFAPSDPAVLGALMGRRMGAEAEAETGAEAEAGGLTAVTWYITFSANEMVVITRKGNPLGIGRMADLAGEGIRVVRVTGEKDMATNRTIAFIKNATAAEGRPDLGAGIIDGTAVRAGTIPEAVQALKEGRADAGIVYLSAAVAASDAVEILRFPAPVNLSDAIRNAVTILGTATSPAAAGRFVRFLLSAEGREILQKAGQPPVVPPIEEGSVPAGLW